MSPEAVEAFASWMEREALQHPSAPVLVDRLAVGASLVRSMGARIDTLEAALAEIGNEIDACVFVPGPPRSGRCDVHQEWWPCEAERVRQIIKAATKGTT